MSNWYARTCEMNRDTGLPTIELHAGKLTVLLDAIQTAAPNHWVVWKDGEYRETLTTLWSQNQLGELYCLHTHDNKKGSAPRPDWGDPKELEAEWWEGERQEIEKRLYIHRHRLKECEEVGNVYHQITNRIAIQHFTKKLRKIPA